MAACRASDLAHDGLQPPAVAVILLLGMSGVHARQPVAQLGGSARLDHELGGDRMGDEAALVRFVVEPVEL